MSSPVWITGANGLIGDYLVQTAPRYAPATPTVGLTRADLELTDFAAVRRAFESQCPQAIIHCAAITKISDCQANPALARLVNIEVTKLLAELAADIPFVFFSTDLVFDGRAGNYDELAPVNPLSLYGETKVAGEAAVLANPRHTVVRTSLNCGPSRGGDRAMEEQIRGEWQAGKTLRLFTDEFRCPIPAQATARAVWELLARQACGLFHVAGSERVSRWQIGQLLAARWPEVNPRLEPASLKEYAGTPRAADTSLNCGKAQRLLSFPLPRFSEWAATLPGKSGPLTCGPVRGT